MVPFHLAPFLIRPFTGFYHGKTDVRVPNIFIKSEKVLCIQSKFLPTSFGTMVAPPKNSYKSMYGKDLGRRI